MPAIFRNVYRGVVPRLANSYPCLCFLFIFDGRLVPPSDQVRSDSHVVAFGGRVTSSTGVRPIANRRFFVQRSKLRLYRQFVFRGREYLRVRAGYVVERREMIFCFLRLRSGRSLESSGYVDFREP